MYTPKSIRQGHPIEPMLFKTPLKKREAPQFIHAKSLDVTSEIGTAGAYVKSIP